MRSVVSKPGKSQGDEKSPQVSVIKAKTFENSPARASRAKTVGKNKGVTHFATPQPLKISGVGLDIAAPRAKTPTKPASAPSNKSVVAATAVRPMPSMVTSVSHQHMERLLDQALTYADSHKKSRKAPATSRSLWQRVKQAPRWMSLGSSLAIVALLAGFFIWQNIPQIAMRVAASKAHISASMPAYTPSGFSYTAPINYAKGAITINYKSAGNSARHFAITQESSTMTSRSLAATSIPAQAQVQTAQINGTTVYIYGDKNDATWVNHGVRYTITDRASLNSDQILRIANSL
jgi:hypothetical protein